jgi:hypothetical protein
MLAPRSSSGSARVVGVDAFTLVRSPDAGTSREWIEVRDGAGASVFLPVPMMPLVHEAFARALPGFGPFGSHRFEGESLRQLRDELDAIAQSVRGLPVAEARRRWPSADVLAGIGPEAAWEPCRAAFVRTLDELSAFLDAVRRRGSAVTVAPIQ